MINRSSLRPVVTFLVGCAAASVVCVLVKGTKKSSDIAADLFGGPSSLTEADERPRVITDESLNPSQIPRSCETQLLILIISDVRQKWKRDAQRQSWVGTAEAKYQDFGLTSAKFQHRYVVGRLFEEITPGVLGEARVHKDIVVAPQNDYDSEAATAKVAWAVRWAVQHCTFSHLMKVEDHSFVNLPLVMRQWLPSMSATKFYSGMVMDSERVSRDPDSNWYMPEENYPGRRYPPFPRLHFVMSKDVARTLGDVMSPALEKVFYDDVGVANALSTKEISPKNEGQVVHTNHECELKKPYLVLKVLYAEEMLLFGKKMFQSADQSIC